MLAVFAGGAGPASAEEATRRVFVMGTWLDVAVTATDRLTAIAAAEAALAAVESTEKRLSTWRPDSELAALNRSRPGSWVGLSSELARDLREALGWARNSAGWFNPGVASLVRVWDLRGPGTVPSRDGLAQALAGSDVSAFELRGSHARRLSGGFGIEEGGFGKGIALRDAAAAALAADADCVRFDFGGQTHAAGDCPTVRIGIAHPRDRATEVASIEVASGSVATSGNGERGIVVDGVRLGHVLDPHSGRPAADFGSVTVLAADPVAADCLSTALFARGPRLGSAWLESHPDIGAVFVIDRGSSVEILASDALLGRVSIDDPAVAVTAIGPVDPAEGPRAGAVFSGLRPPPDEAIAGSEGGGDRD